MNERTGFESRRKRQLVWLMGLFVLGGGLLALISIRGSSQAPVNVSALLCAANLNQIGAALAQYQNTHGALPDADGPAGLEQLRATGQLTETALLVCPAGTTRPASAGETLEGHCDYLYSSPPAQPPPAHGTLPIMRAACGHPEYRLMQEPDGNLQFHCDP